MIEVDRVERRLADDCALARGKFADDPLIDRPLAMADGRDLEDLLHLARAQITARLTERRFGFERVRADLSLYDDLGARRYQRIESLRWHDVDGRAIQRAG